MAPWQVTLVGYTTHVDVIILAIRSNDIIFGVLLHNAVCQLLIAGNRVIRPPICQFACLVEFASCDEG